MPLPRHKKTAMLRGLSASRPNQTVGSGTQRASDAIAARSRKSKPLRYIAAIDNQVDLVALLTCCGVRGTDEGLTFTGEDSPMTNLLLFVIWAFAEIKRKLIRGRSVIASPNQTLGRQPRRAERAERRARIAQLRRRA